MLETIKKQAKAAITELIEISRIKKSEILVIGCSTSEISGQNIGTHSSVEIAKVVFDAVYPAIKSKGLFLAAQCCEHLNRAIILEKEAAEIYRLETVNVVPQPRAGGAFAYAAYNAFENPVAVEEIKASAGLDIGDTLIGMHLKKVAIPVRLSISKIGQAHITAARTRPKLIGGSRAVYDEGLL